MFSVLGAGVLLRAGTQFDLLKAGIADIQRAVAAGALTYERLVQLYLKRIETFDKQGPRLNAILQIHPRALEIARSLDQERRGKGLRSPLHGIPVAIKDSVDVSDMPSASGSLAFAGTYPAYDSTVVRKLREAGAIIFLKTNLDEFNFSAQGLSSLGGQVLNPYDLKRNPGGSSAGTGVAVNVGFATVGIGTETGASVRSPASNNSLVGVVPTSGLVSRAGVLLVSFTQDRVGVHAKSVADAAVMLTHMRGFDAEDLFTWECLGKIDSKPYTDSLEGASFRGERIGILRGLFRQGQEFQKVNALIDREIALIRQQGAVLVDGLHTDMDLISFFPFARVGQNEFRRAFEAYLKRRGETLPIKSLDDLVESGKYLKNIEGTLREAQRVPPPEQNPEYLARLKNRAMLRELMIELMDRHRVEMLVYPFKSLPAPPLGASDRGPRDNPISAITGLPAIVIPAGVSEEGLPVSIEFLGRPFSELTLFRLAAAYENISHRRFAPTTTPNLEGEIFEY
ncbi:MAG: amidase [Acidobacteria bacterium]|nr:amidase [Acidobacteriota bacterium]